MTLPHRRPANKKGKPLHCGFPLLKLDSGMRRRLTAWIPAFLWMALLFYLSSRSTLPSLPRPGWDTVFKKSGHFVAYGILALLYLYTLTRDAPLTPGRLWLAWGLAALYGISDEVHQSFVPGRNPAVTDCLINAAGAATALILARWVARRCPPAESTAQS